jgi:hypothetical protein
VVAAVVLTVNVEVCDGVIEAGDRPHVGGSLAPEGLDVIAHVKAIEPLNPPDGITLIVEVFPLVAPGLTVMLPLLVSVNVDAAAGFTVTLTVVVCTSVPEVPVTVMT